MPELLQEVLTFLTIGAAASWVVWHLVRKPARCDGCDAPAPTRSRRGVRPSGLKVLDR